MRKSAEKRSFLLLCSSHKTPGVNTKLHQHDFTVLSYNIYGLVLDQQVGG